MSSPNRRFQPAVDLGTAFGLREPTGVVVRPLMAGPGPAGDARVGALAHPALLLDGVILRSVTLRQRTGALLHGAGDVLPGGDLEPEPFSASSRVLVPTRLLPLDPLTMTAASHHRALAPRIAAAVARQSDQLALQSIVAQLTSIEQRLELLLPELADRWGTVTGEGVTLPAFFSHTVLAALIGVRRPSLTTGLATLSRPGFLRRLDDRRWLLAPEWAGIAAA
jgi:CRP-like cAMP-binding protein